MLHQLSRSFPALLAFALVLGFTATASAGPAAGQPGAGQGPYGTAGVPVMAVVSISRQWVTVYDARGKMMESPVSTGRSGYETPAGVFGIIQKNRDHYSNLYENAPMPFM